MKKVFIIGLLAGVCGYAQAINITNTISGPSSLVGNNALVGTYAYEWGVSAATSSSKATTGIYVPTGDTLQSVTINITGITLTSESAGTLYVDILSGILGGNKTGVQSFNDNDVNSDYFTKVKYSASKYNGDLVNFSTTSFKKNVTQNLSIDITGSALSLLESSLLLYGYFDIGLDPDCYYDVGGICLTYTVAPQGTKIVSTPDTATTALLFGASLLGLEVLRRRFILAKAK